MTRHYLTTADDGYLPRLKVLYASMLRHCGDFRLHLLAAGPAVALWALDHRDRIELHTVERFLERHPEMRPESLPGPLRKRIDEKLCTWRWTFAAEVVEIVGAVTCLDADIMFWGSPEPVFEEIGDADMAVIPHALARKADGIPGVTVETHGQFGLYNGGFVYFAGPSPAHLMAELTRQWCFPGWRTHADGRKTYGDQGYLELVVEQLGERAHVIELPGACPGPWNINRLSDLGTLVAYHYMGFRFEANTHPGYDVDSLKQEILYGPYRQELLRAGERDPRLSCKVCGRPDCRIHQRNCNVCGVDLCTTHPQSPDERNPYHLASQIWCEPRHAHKVMDPELAESIAAVIIEDRQKGRER